MGVFLETVEALVAVAAGIATVLVGIVTVVRSLRPATICEIISPSNKEENRGRILSPDPHGRVNKRRKGREYWIAIQPSDCRDAASWWPQNHPLSFDRVGHWTISRVRLGRDIQAGGQDDVGKTYTVALVEVPPVATELFADQAALDERLELPARCRVLTSVEVKRAS